MQAQSSSGQSACFRPWTACARLRVSCWYAIQIYLSAHIYYLCMRSEKFAASVREDVDDKKKTLEAMCTYNIMSAIINVVAGL